MPLQKDPEGVETKQLLQAVDFSNRRVLEIGCGDGRLTWRYALFAQRITAIDIDSSALQQALNACQPKIKKKTTFICADSVNLPFRHGIFDIAILSWTL
jgi:ubiquinone/menaquinone biosynthesis C-methylase UbiE